ncbi:transposase [Streptomyces mirabilis]|uniref:transposase n=1 Tax=Streptomyces mirabilis TaxID=68239 RepID=UPI0036B9429D
MFEVEPVGKRQPQARPAAVDKRFRAFDPHQVLLLPLSLDDCLPQDHLARFVAGLVDKVLHLGQVRADYTDERGYPPYDPRLMLRLLIYGYTTRVRSSRAIEQRCADDIAFRFLAADQAPGFRSISRFRRLHLDALAALFTQSLHLTQKLGMVKMSRIALDGTKLEANASKHKAMSYGRLVDKEERIEADVAALEAKAAALLAAAEATDEAEDQEFGIDGRDTDLPAERDRREKRLARLQAARAQIEVEAADKARAHAEDKERRRQGRASADDDQAVTDAGEAAAAKTRPTPKSQANFTDPDPDSRIMKNSDGAYIQAYDAQAVVDAEHQVSTAADVTTNEQVPPAPGGRLPASATLKERMACKLLTKPGKAAYSRRKAIEPVFGQMTTCQNGDRLLPRGEDGARGEWRLLAACHNLRKIVRHAGLTALAG